MNVLSVRPTRIATERLKPSFGVDLRRRACVRPTRIATERLKHHQAIGNAVGSGQTDPNRDRAIETCGTVVIGPGVRPTRIATERLKPLSHAAMPI